MKVYEVMQLAGIALPFMMVTVFSMVATDDIENFIAAIAILVMIFIAAVATIVVSAIKDAIKEQS